jgi:hypothetical protein
MPFEKDMNQERIRIRDVCFWGLLFSVFFLYLYEIALVSSERPVVGSEHLYDIRFAYGKWYELISHFRQALISLSFPSYAISINVLPSDPYFDNCIYFPFLAGVQWFFYGCIFGWWRSRNRLKKL